MSTSKSMFYDIVLYDRIAVMAHRYLCKLNDSNDTYFNKTKHEKILNLTEHLWGSLKMELDKLYPEFINSSKSFSVIFTKRNDRIVLMSVSRPQGKV